MVPMVSSRSFGSVVRGDGYKMAFEYPTEAGLLRLLKVGRRWTIEFNGSLCGRWPSPDDAVAAAVRHRTGLLGWDRTQIAVSDDLLRWRPVGDSL
jgi:hypothetical protein